MRHRDRQDISANRAEKGNESVGERWRQKYLSAGRGYRAKCGKEGGGGRRERRECILFSAESILRTFESDDKKAI